MNLKVSQPEHSGDFSPAPAGTHMARCRQVIDLGHQYQAQHDKWARKVTIGWELPSELRDDGTPFVVWSRYTASLNEKSYLYRDLTSWRGRPFTDEELKGFDLVSIVGAPCMLTLIHNVKGDNVYANIASVSGCPKGTTVPEAITQAVIFDLDDPDMVVWDTFSDHLQGVINASQERTAKPDQSTDQAQTHTPSDEPVATVRPDDDVPF